MVKKLTFKMWLSSIPILLFCAVIATILLNRYGLAALQALQGKTPELAQTESMTNIYGVSALAMVFVIFDILIIVRQLSHSVGKKVRTYLNANTGVTKQELESDFAAAEEIGNLWIGRKWSYSYELDDIPIENSKIVLVYNEAERSSGSTVYYLCLGLIDGKVGRMRVSKDDIPNIFDTYGRFSHILTGNNPEYKLMFKKDMNALLNIRYRSRP